MYLILYMFFLNDTSDYLNNFFLFGSGSLRAFFFNILSFSWLVKWSAEYPIDSLFLI